MWLIATLKLNTPDLVGMLFKPILTIVIVYGVVCILIEILKPVRPARGRRRGWPRKRREMSRDEARAKLAGIGLLAFAAFEWWLWKCKGFGGRFLAIAIPFCIIALWVIVAMKLRRRKVVASDRLERPDLTRYHTHIPSPASGAADVKSEAVAIEVGEVGENMVRAVIKSLPSDRYVVLHDVWLPMADGGETQIDHVIVSPFGIFIVETKNWKGTIYADAKSAVWTKFNLGHKDTYKNPIHQNYKHLISVREKFSRQGTEFVFGVVAMSPAAEFKGGVPEGVVFYNELNGWILGHVTPCIKPDQIVDIVAAIKEWSATVSEDSRRRHLSGSAQDERLRFDGNVL